MSSHRSSLLLVWFLICAFAVPPQASAQVWTVLAVDAQGDGRDPSLPDVAQLSYRYDATQDLLWFRVSLYGKPEEKALGVSIAVDTGAAEADKVNWWGQNKDFKFDRLVTAWVTRENGAWQGTMGVADAAGVRDRKLNNLKQDNLQIRTEGDSIVIGVKRTDVTDKMKMNLIAAVGSNVVLNDEIPDTRFVTIDLSAPRPVRGLREIDFSRNNFLFPPEYKLLHENQPPSIIRKGHGKETLILIPGVYSGNDAFAAFTTRNESQYRFFIITPPGLNGTPARPLPPETTSYGEFTWTRLLERDIVNLIKAEKLQKPVLVAHGFPGSLAAVELAATQPKMVGGIIDVAALPVQFSPSPKDPTRRTPATPAERVQVVDKGWAQKWFKYVTPETWESNNYPADMLLNDPARAEHVRRQFESAPLQVKIRYLTEFMASDQTRELSSLQVPLLALRPGFNESLLADPAHAWYKLFFQDSWEPFSRNPQIKLLTIPNARALILDDQPGVADAAIAEFVEHVRVVRSAQVK